jgi:hypothetical protein
VDTLRELPGRLGLAPECKLFWIIGSDNLHGFERWRDVREILERAQPVAVARAGEWESALARIRGVLGEAAAAAVERGLVREPPLRVSATDLRAALAKGGDAGRAAEDGGGLRPGRDVVSPLTARARTGTQEPLRRRFTVALLSLSLSLSLSLWG